jgi:hypothetical protein
MQKIITAVNLEGKKINVMGNRFLRLKKLC